MKKLLSCLLIFMVTLKNLDKIVEMGPEAPMSASASLSEETTPIKMSVQKKAEKQEDRQKAEENIMLELMSQPVEAIYYSDIESEQQNRKVVEENLRLISDDIPMSYADQKSLQEACEEFGVPYAMALGLIEKETNFQNIIGDDGASTGYMQVQQRWHYDRMERLGVYNLNDPKGNFRVGLDYLSECYDIYGSWDLALTVYNMGHNPGYITGYAYDVMNNYEKWLGVVGAF